MVSLMPSRSMQVAAGLIVCIGLTAAGGHACRAALDDASLSARLKQQTQAFFAAGAQGDATVLARYLDPAVVVTNEAGEVLTRQQVVERAQPQAAGAADRHVDVANWVLHRQGDVATATFVDVLTINCHGEARVQRRQSTETWAKRPGGWKLIASHTMALPRDPVTMTGDGGRPQASVDGAPETRG